MLSNAAILIAGRRKQRGAALMVMMVIMVMGALAFLVSSLNSSALKTVQQATSAATMARAKEVIMGYVVNGTGGGQRPGDMPYPDRLIEAAPNYDGNTDSCPPLQTAPNPSGCFGRFPWLTLGMSLSAASDNDPMGIMPWYAVSANLIDPAGVTFNSELLNNAPHTWLTVRDMKGNVLSNRVAIIIAIPGAALPGQNRPLSPNLGGASQYLDSIDVPVGCIAPCIPGTYKNFDLDDDFIIGDERRWVPDLNDNTKQTEDYSYQFNDKLIYVTIDELMPLIEKRVGNEIRKILNTYFMAWGAFPFAAPFSDPSLSSFTGQAATYKGLLPTDDQSYIPIWNADPTSSFGGMSCTRTDGYSFADARWRCESSSSPGSNFTIPAGVTVTISGKLNSVGFGLWRPHNINNVCEVRARNSSGATALVTSLFAPNSVTVSNSLNSDGSANIVFRAKGKAGGTTLQRIEFRDILSYTTDIKTNSNSASCPQASTSPAIPAWLPNNNWHQLMYYVVSQGYAPGGNHTCTVPCLTVKGQGGGGNKQALLVLSSGALAGQAHPSGTLANYLEGENTTPADFIFENKARASNFNDQVIIVAP